MVQRLEEVLAEFVSVHSGLQAHAGIGPSLSQPAGSPLVADRGS